MGLLLTVRWLLSVSVAFLFVRIVDADCNSEESLLCEPSAYSVYPQDVYGIEGQQLCITCQHPNISNNPVFQTGGVDLTCPNCDIDLNQGRLCFDPINADNLGATYVCQHQISFTCYCHASFTIFRGVKFIQNPENQTVDLGQEGVNISCALSAPNIFWRWIHRLNSQQLPPSNNRLFNITNEGVLYFQSPVTIRSHGTYQCDVPGRTKSYIGHLNVAGAPLLEFFPESNNTNFEAMGDSDIEHTILTFGYPTPTFTLRKKTGYCYTTVESSNITLTTEMFILNGVQQSDSGDYQIVADNTYGSYMLNFTLNVTGTADMSLVTNHGTQCTTTTDVNVSATLGTRMSLSVTSHGTQNSTAMSISATLGVSGVMHTQVLATDTPTFSTAFDDLITAGTVIGIILFIIIFLVLVFVVLLVIVYRKHWKNPITRPEEPDGDKKNHTYAC